MKSLEGVHQIQQRRTGAATAEAPSLQLSLEDSRENLLEETPYLMDGHIKNQESHFPLSHQQLELARDVDGKVLRSNTQMDQRTAAFTESHVLRGSSATAIGMAPNELSMDLNHHSFDHR